jgi:hypothetical protein
MVLHWKCVISSIMRKYYSIYEAALIHTECINRWICVQASYFFDKCNKSYKELMPDFQIYIFAT